MVPLKIFDSIKEYLVVCNVQYTIGFKICAVKILTQGFLFSILINQVTK